MADFGRDLFCLDSIRTGRYATGATLVGQRFYHRLITKRGALIGGEDEANFGEDLGELVGESGEVKDLERKIRTKVNRAAQLEEAILKATTTINTSIDDAGAITHDVTIEAETKEGPFRLVLSIDEVTVELVGLSAEAA